MGRWARSGFEPLQLPVDDGEVLLGVPALAAGHVHHMDQQPAALHVAQELVPRPTPSQAPSMRPGMSAMTKDFPWGMVTTPSTGVRVGEVVVGDVGFGLADHGD